MDTDLPGLALATDPVEVAALLRTTGLLSGTGTGAEVRLTVRASRPGRRAVVEAEHPGLATGRVFLKVCRPQVLSRIRRRYTLVAGSGVPSPQVLATVPAGVLVLSALPGRGLREVLRVEGPDAVDPASLVAVLDVLPDSLLSVGRRRSWSDNAGWYAESIGEAQPGEARRAAGLAEAITRALAGSAPPIVPTHGDFYESQLLVLRGRISGVLDLDGAGPGHRDDDLACALAHLVLLEHLAAGAGRTGEASRLGAAFARWDACFRSDPRIEASSLRVRTAGVLLSLATGPRRVADADWPAATSARLDLVEARLG